MITTGKRGATDEFVAVGGLRLHYRERGDAAAPAVVLLHGLTGNAWEWDPIAAVLSRRFRVLALDQRGHGASAWASDYSAERMVDDIAGFAAALELRTFAIVGHSMGGLNAYLFAARHPELVPRLVIVDFGPDSMTAAASREWSASLRAAAQATYGHPREALEEWQAANSCAREAELRHFIVHSVAEGEDGRWRWRFDAAGLPGFLDSTPTEAAQWSAIRRVACPTLMLRGEHSEVLSSATAARMVHELSDGRLVEIAGGAHDLTVEQPVALTAAVDDFLAIG